MQTCVKNTFNLRILCACGNEIENVTDSNTAGIMKKLMQEPVLCNKCKRKNK